ALAVSHFGLDQVANLFAAKGKAKRLFGACVFTYAGVMAVALFNRTADPSGLLIALSAVTLFALANAIRVVFLVVLEAKRRSGHGGVRVLVVGTDEFAQAAVGS